MNNQDDVPLLESPATLNPYRRAAGLLASRLAWDVRSAAWISRRRLRALNDRYAGKKAVILCNGPSLLQVDFEALGDVFTFGLNKINLLFDRSEFRPSCVVAVNPLVIEQNADFFNATDLPLFIDSGGSKHVRMRKQVTFLHSTPFPGFARDCSWSIFQGHTVTYVAMQLAFHMGFADVAIVGCDHDFASKGPANKAVVSGEVDVNHFDPRYFSGGVQWHLPDLFESEMAYARAKHIYQAFGRRLVNATVGGKLEVFDRMDLSSFIGR